MTPEWVEAYEILQKRYEQAQKRGWLDWYTMECFDRALDYLSRNPHLVGVPGHLAVKAWRAGAKQLRRQKQRKATVETAQAPADDPALAVDDHAAPERSGILVLDFLLRLPLPAQDRIVLELLAAGKTALEISAQYGISLQQARVRISRARSRGWSLWLAA